MKKLLCILSTLSLVITGVTPIILNKTNTTSNLTSLQSGTSFRLKKSLMWLEPSVDNSALPCSIAMVLNYYNSGAMNQYAAIDDHVQSAPDRAVTFLNSTLAGILPNNNKYFLTNLPTTFGADSRDLRMLQQYVTANMSLDIPVILGADRNQTVHGHAIVITGIDTDFANPLNSRYYVNDPNDSQLRSMSGAELAVSFASGGGLIGAKNNFDFNKKIINVLVPDLSHSKWIGPVYGDHSFAVTQKVDLAVEAGITDFFQLKKIKYIALDQMYANFYYDGMKKEGKIDLFRNDNTFINDWSGWQYLAQFSGTLSYGLNYCYVDFWHGTNFGLLGNGDFGGRLSYRVNSSCSGFAKYPALNLDMGSIWKIVY